MPPRWLSVAAVAKLRGISMDKVYDDIRTGRLSAYTVAGMIRIREDDARSYDLKPKRLRADDEV